MTDYYLGIEISGKKFKISTFIKRGGKYHLFSLDSLEFSQDWTENKHSFQNWISKKLINADDIKAIVTVPESLLFIKEITLPKVNLKKVKEMAYWEIISTSPFSSQEASFDCKIIDQDKSKVKVLTVAMKNELSDKILTSLTDSGITVLGIEPSSLAFSRVANANFKRVTLLLTVETDETNLLILKEGLPVFTTSVSVLLKSSKKDRRRLSPGVIKDLALNTKKIIDYWQKRENIAIEQVIITGDIANKYFGLASSINKILKIPVILARARKIKKVNLDGVIQSLVVRNYIPIGAVLRIFYPTYQEINLFSKDAKGIYEKQKRSQEIKKGVNLFNQVSLIILFILIAFLGLIKFYENILAKDIAQIQKFVQNHPAQKFTDEINKTNEIIRNVNRLTNEQKDVGTLLHKIADNTPQNIKLVTIEFSDPVGGTWVVTGSGAREDVLAFYEKLKQEPKAENVSMLFSSLSKANENNFSITILWK